MAETARNLVDRYGELMSNGDVDALAEMYAPDAKLVLFNRVMSGREEIRRFLARRLASHGGYYVVSVDQFQDAGDVVIWEANVEVEIGFLQTTHVVVLNSEGLIQHHIPGIRGYWGM
jgi:ketosteroid isomerase-like protein